MTKRNKIIYWSHDLALTGNGIKCNCENTHNYN